MNCGFLSLFSAILGFAFIAFYCARNARPVLASPPHDARDDDGRQGANRLVEQGRQTFRYDTFGDENFWGGTLQLHRAIEGARLGGVGPGVSPATALAVGLKVDVDALPPQLLAALKAGKVNLNDPRSTLALLRANSVVGLTGFFDHLGKLKSVGIQCALCHSTVDDSLAPGIGHRRDLWANRAPDGCYRTSPLKGLWTHTNGGFYHDGRFATLGAVVDHYDSTMSLHLSDQEKHDLVEFLKSL